MKKKLKIDVVFKTFGVITPLAGVVYAVTQNPTHLIYAVGIALLIIITFSCINEDTLNAIIYFFSPSGKNYNIMESSFLYTFFNKTDVQSEKRYQVKFTRNGVTSMPDCYSWTEDGPKEVRPLYAGQHVSYRWKHGNWDNYTVEFGKTYFRNSVTNTGTVLCGLKTNDYKSKLFLSCGIYEKTKSILLTIKVPPEILDEVASAQLQAFKNSGDIFGNDIFSVPVEYDSIRQHFSVRIEYPRKGWRYMLKLHCIEEYTPHLDQSSC